MKVRTVVLARKSASVLVTVIVICSQDIWLVRPVVAGAAGRSSPEASGVLEALHPLKVGGRMIDDV